MKNKDARDAKTPDDIFPGGHEPTPEHRAAVLTSVMKMIEAALPGLRLTLFVAEIVPSAPGRLPRFNYISNGAREDMLAVCEAFVAKNKPLAQMLHELDASNPANSRN